MNIRDLILPLILSLLTVFGIRYFFSSFVSKTSTQSEQVGSGLQMTAPSHKEMYRPLEREIDFDDNQTAVEASLVTITTNSSVLHFSNQGACLQDMTTRLDEGQELHIVDASTDTEREWRTFLVALNEQTPFYYKLTKHDTADDQHVLRYTASNNDVVINKTYVVYINKDQIDLELEVNPKKGDKVWRPRVLFKQPLPKCSARYSALFVQGRDAKFKSKSMPTKETNAFWVQPTLFGLSSRYTISALVKDPSYFVQRGYYSINGQGNVFGLLEGPEITQPTTWKLSFYIGPKIPAALTAVDARLKNTVNYGWLAPITKPLVSLLKWMNGYVGNYGLTIILLTLLFKLLTLPFMPNPADMGKKQKEFQRRLAAVQQRYKNDPERLNVEKAALIKQHGIPGFGSCLPMLLQLPIFIGLNSALTMSASLYQAHFLWLQDLSAPDPYYILPVLAGVGVMVQMSSMQARGKKAPQQLTGVIVGLVLTVLFSSLPSGVVLFIATNTLVTFAYTALKSSLRR